eukprot:gnl/TRDRNA2_/TRDRNA2_74671_c0_seq1.p1 gnl/TRDRNA2_/TRDRNA2_74671_c0~~gnl/TRDRNA2_/TRDRNA2_74671_c0_seq1.p1  ORF type:complete len:304 (-),score=73.34 gnl/TRDRNA2_/TRDRNA2_74671_c0_seq1:137-985(-)
MLMDVMKEHPKDYALQTAIAESLTIMSRDSLKNRNDIIAAGAPKRIVAALKGHFMHVPVLLSMLELITNLATDSKENAKALGKAGSVPAVMKILKAGTEHHRGPVMSLSAMALGKLSQDNKERKKIVKEGGIEQIIRNMRFWKVWPDMQQAGCDALRHLADDGTENRVRVKQAGGVEVCVKALEDHTFEVETVKSACKALWSMAGSYSYSRKEVVERLPEFADSGFSMSCEDPTEQKKAEMNENIVDHETISDARDKKRQKSHEDSLERMRDEEGPFIHTRS